MFDRDVAAGPVNEALAAMVAAAGPEPVPDPDSGSEPLDEAADEVAAALGGNRSFQLNRLDKARFVLAWLPMTWAAMRAGALGWYEAVLISRAAGQLSDRGKIARLERLVVPKGVQDLARRLRRAVARLDPEAAKKKAERRRVERSLVIFNDIFGEGGCELRASGPSELLAQIAAAIDLEAKQRVPGDCRTIATRRFDVLVEWAQDRLGLHEHADTDTPSAPATPAEVALAEGQPDPPGEAVPEGQPPPAPTAEQGRRRGRCSSCGRSGPPRVPINVTVPMETLLGLSAAPGEIAGWGLIDADTARELAADGEWRRWLVDEGTGRLLDVDSGTYRPNAALESFVRARDRTCRFPGCHQPAVRCDLDHTLAFHTEGGRTAADNLTTLCRHHHRLKHEAEWIYEVVTSGGHLWTSPCGFTYLRPPEQLHEIDWEAVLAEELAARERHRQEAGEPPADGSSSGQDPHSRMLTDFPF